MICLPDSKASFKCFAALVDMNDQPRCLFKRANGLAQLAIEGHTVGDHDHGIENAFIIGTVQRSQAVGQPADGIRFTAAGTVLDQVILAGPFSRASATKRRTADNWW